MTRLINADALLKAICSYPYGYRGMIKSEIENQPTVDAVPIKWLTAQAENPSNSDELRNAIDYIVYTLWAEREEE